MSGNSFGKILKLTTFGESHGPAIGGVLEGIPAGLKIDRHFIQHQLNRRKPGQSAITSPRKESDEVEILSGIFDETTLGTPIGFLVRNSDQKPEDYAKLRDVFRPSHADFTYESKYGIRDYRGGGRSSARETLARVAAGSIAQLLLKKSEIQIFAYVSQVHQLKLNKHYSELDLSQIDSNIIRCPDASTANDFIERIELMKANGNTVGGSITCVIKNVPAGLGEPVFDKLHADLGKAMLSINAVKGFEIGSGFDAMNFTGKELNDTFEMRDEKIRTSTNHSGGIQGGISNGEDIYFRVAFKPIATIMREQNTVTRTGEATSISAKGRHDPCVLPRAIPIVESMSALVIADHLLRNKTSRM
jgi:chorismate synthase